MKAGKRIGAAILVACCLFAFAACSSNESALKGNVENMIANSIVANQIKADADKAFDALDSYAQGEKTVDALADELEGILADLDALEPVIADDSLKKASVSDPKLGEAPTYGEFVESLIDEVEQSIEFLYEINVGYGDLYTKQQNLELIDLYRKFYDCEMGILWYTINDYLKEYTGDTELDSFIESARNLSCFSKYADSWSGDADEVMAQYDYMCQSQDDILARRAERLGDLSNELDKMKAQLAERQSQGQ